ncbi:hypothetical protein HanPI659440_Chr17g0691311 [Helianthus annuus]|nr:hypothetical protein HanPI659440_Chr17g0691311 [Helianthus annuus]
MMMMMLLTAVIILWRFLFFRWNLVVADDVRGVDDDGHGGSEVCRQLVGDDVPTASLMVMGIFGIRICFGWIGFRGSVGSGSINWSWYKRNGTLDISLVVLQS